MSKKNKVNINEKPMLQKINSLTAERDALKDSLDKTDRELDHYKMKANAMEGVGKYLESENKKLKEQIKALENSFLMMESVITQYKSKYSNSPMEIANEEVTITEEPDSFKDQVLFKNP